MFGGAGTVSYSTGAEPFWGRSWRLRLLASAAISGLCAVFACPVAADSWPTRQLIDLGSLGAGSTAIAISANGKIIAGSSLTASGDLHAVSWADGATMPTDLGTLGGNASQANAISADGKIIVGYAQTGTGGSHAVSWSNGAITPTDLGTLGGNISQANAISADGNVIVGISQTDTGTQHAVSWSNGATVPTDLGTLGGDISLASAISADGRVIVGYSQTDTFSEHAVSWVDGATAPTDLGTLGGDRSYAAAVSANGKVIIGFSETGTGGSHAVSWSNGAITPTDLGTLGGNFSQANAISADGNVIVGLSLTDTGFQHAVSWSNGATVPTDLGTLPGGFQSSASAVSANGRVIVGAADTSTGALRAVLWINGATTPTNLGTLGGDMSITSAVSANGDVVIGYSLTSSGSLRAFVLRLRDEPNGGGVIPPVMQDFTGIRMSFPLLANDTALAVSRQQTLVTGLLAFNCSVAPGRDWCLSAGVDGLMGRESGASGIFSVGRAIGDMVTVGISAQFTSAGGLGQSNAVSTDMTSAGALWAKYSQNGAAGTGLQLEAAAGYGHADATIYRGRGLSHVEITSGSAGLDTVAASVSAGYGFILKDWLITPSAALTVAHTTRGAYAEGRNFDFPVEYDRLRSTVTYATFSVGGVHALFGGSLGLEGGVRTDVQADRIRLSGSSTIPGLASLSQAETFERNPVRPFAGVSYTRALNEWSSFSISASASRPDYGTGIQGSLRAVVSASF